MKDENCYNKNMFKRQNMLGYAVIKVRKQLYIKLKDKIADFKSEKNQ